MAEQISDNGATMDEFDAKDAKSEKSWITSLLSDKTSEPAQPETFPKTGEAIMPVHRDADEYNMNHQFRGKAVIFNHKTFTVDGLSIRNGTDCDRDKLAETLKNLDFQVEIYNDLSYQKVGQTISNLSQADHSQSDCLVIAVFSHGIPNKIYASDASYDRDHLWDAFTAERCPSLAGKPKIFLIQACQGDKLDGGTHLRQPKMRGLTVVDSAPQKSDAYKIPNRADFFMAFSTYPGYYSWRNTSQGSWFIQSVCKVLNKEGHHRAFMELMTVVARQVALEFESFVPYSDMDQQKQVVFATTTLIREIYFRPKSTSGVCLGSIKMGNEVSYSSSHHPPLSLSKPILLSPRTSHKSERDSAGGITEEDFPSLSLKSPTKTSQVQVVDSLINPWNKKLSIRQPAEEEKTPKSSLVRPHPKKSDSPPPASRETEI